MALGKAVERVDGAWRIDVNVKFVLDAGAVVGAVVLELAADSEDYTRDLFHADLDRAVRTQLHLGGRDRLDFWHDQYHDPDELERATRWAESQVRRLRPDLFRPPTE